MIYMMYNTMILAHNFYIIAYIQGAVKHSPGTSFRWMGGDLLIWQDLVSAMQIIHGVFSF